MPDLGQLIAYLLHTQPEPDQFPFPNDGHGMANPRNHQRNIEDQKLRRWAQYAQLKLATRPFSAIKVQVSYKVKNLNP